MSDIDKRGGGGGGEGEIRRSLDTVDNHNERVSKSTVSFLP